MRKWFIELARTENSNRDLIARFEIFSRPIDVLRITLLWASDFKTTYEPAWFYDGRLAGVCNPLTREHMPAELHR